jgi:Xaa-Pro aminopeptidase
VDKVWGSDRPAVPLNPIRHHPLELSGQSSRDKIEIIQRQLRDLFRPFALVSMLDEVAWLLNIRGSDIDYNPVVRSYVVIPDQGQVHWFLPQGTSREMETEVKAHLGLDSADPLVVILPYEEIEYFLTHLTASSIVSSNGDRDSTSSGNPPQFCLNSTQLNWRLYSAIERSLEAHSAMKIKPAPSLLAKMKSVKNEAELAGMRKSHLRDGVALTAFFAWLERTMKEAKEQDLAADRLPAEFDLVEVLESFRRKMEHFVSPSFATISSFGPNGLFPPSPLSSAWFVLIPRRCGDPLPPQEPRLLSPPGLRFSVSLRLRRSVSRRNHRCDTNSSLRRAHAEDEGVLHSCLEGLILPTLCP